jgi:hypothetical protein
MEAPPAKAHARHADPLEPWRYECTECGSVSIYESTSGSYLCVSCDAGLDVVYDKKHDSLARP